MNLRTSPLLYRRNVCRHACQWGTRSTPSLGKSRHAIPTAGDIWTLPVSLGDTTPTAHETRQSEEARSCPVPHPPGATRTGPRFGIFPYTPFATSLFLSYATRLLDSVYTDWRGYCRRLRRPQVCFPRQLSEYFFNTMTEMRESVVERLERGCRRYTLRDGASRHGDFEVTAVFFLSSISHGPVHLSWTNLEPTPSPAMVIIVSPYFSIT